ncbi:MAG: Acyltransferase family protein [bacterium ADurb.Bin236]|nr:MAG: Acyltransferase family protein [bacterium ADurb.Bin236]HOY63488.1 acyltransferase [bacterium]HPN94011.1 acyltransferase [bacterium]
MADRDRLNNIVALSSFGIFLVVFGHSYANLTLKDDSFMRFMYSLRSVIYSFHMPLFIFISGYLFLHTTNRAGRLPFAGFVKKKFVRLLVPYLILSPLAFAEKSFFAQFAWKHTEVSFRTFFRGVIYPLSNMNTFFWFLPTLFAIFLFAPLMRKALSKKGNAPLIILITAALASLNIFLPFADVQILNIAGIARLSVYFWLGCLFYSCVPPTMPSAARLAAFSLSLCAFIFLNVTIIASGKTPLLSFLAAVCGIQASFFLFSIFPSRLHSFFAPINGYSYQIYLLSWFFQTAVRVAAYVIFKMNIHAVFALMLISGLAGPVLTAKAVERFLPKTGFVIGLQTPPADKNKEPRHSPARL